MKRILILFALIFIFTLPVSASDIEEKIESEIGISRLEEIVPDSIKDNESLEGMDISYDTASSELTVGNVINNFFKLLFKELEGQLSFAFSIVAFLIISSIYKAFSSSMKRTSLNECISFAISVFLCVILYSGIISALDALVSYVSDLTGFMASLLPFITTVMCIQGSAGEAATSGVILVTVISLIEGVCASIVIPFVKILFAFICAGFMSKMNFSPLTDFITSFATKACTISMSLMSAILYFQHALSASADSLALRSIKLAAGNFIPIVGSMVSEASSTVIAGAMLVKTTLGVFAFAVLLYMTLIPIISFLSRKIILKLLISFSSLLGCDDASKVMSSVYGIYNIMSALMFSCGIFFIIAIAIFVKNGVV